MSRRKPMPQFPRGPRRRGAEPLPTRLEVPVASPQRQLHAMRAFIKPHDWTRAAIRHRLDVDGDATAEQPWRAGWKQAFAEAACAAGERLGLGLSVESSPGPSRSSVGEPVPTGPIHAAVDFAPGASRDAARAVALACSAALPGVWMTLGKLHLINGHFWRRERGRGLSLRRATNIHLPREMRAQLRDLLARRRGA